jgi:hypothetical protein
MRAGRVESAIDSYHIYRRRTRTPFFAECVYQLPAQLMASQEMASDNPVANHLFREIEGPVTRDARTIDHGRDEADELEVWLGGCRWCSPRRGLTTFNGLERRIQRVKI